MLEQESSPRKRNGCSVSLLPKLKAAGDPGDLLFLVGSASVIWSREPPDTEKFVIGKTLLETVLRIFDHTLFSPITLGTNNCFCYVFTWLQSRQLFNIAVLAYRTKVLLFCRILKKVSFVSQQCDKTSGSVWLCRIKRKTLFSFFLGSSLE